MSKDNNPFNIDYAFPGLCSLCHTVIAEFEGSHPNGTPILKRFLPNRRQAQVVLDDNSSMSINLDETCYETFTPDRMGELMESEINGWQNEVDRQDKWDEDKRKDYMDRYSKRFVVSRQDKSWDERDVPSKPDKRKLKIRTRGR